MKRKNASRHSVMIRQRVVLFLLGLILALVLLEGGLRLGGFILISIQEYANVRSAKQKGAYRILCLGESMTQGQYPSDLEKTLNERNIGVSFSVIDKGIVRSNTPAILTRAGSFLAEYHPDMVVAMMGINDFQVQYYQGIPEAREWLFQRCRVYRLVRILWAHFFQNKSREVEPMGDHERVIDKFLPAKTGTLLIAGTSSFEAEQKETSVDVFLAEGSLRKAIEELGRDFRNPSKISQAEVFFKKAIDLNPQNDYAYVGLGKVFRFQGALSQAEVFFRKAIGLNPKNDAAYVELGKVFRFQGKLPQAEDFLKKAIDLNPKNDAAWIALGIVFELQGKFTQAEGSLKKAIDLNPENDYAYVELGRFFRDQGKLSQAEHFFKRAIDLNPKYDDAYRELGGLYRVQGELLKAEALLKKAIEMNPDSTHAFGFLASLYGEMGKPGLAQVYAKRAKELRQGDLAAITVSNYRKLKAILDEKGIKLVCVQYPMRSIEPLKSIFGKDEGVIFVDNEEIFKNAVKKASYKEYFHDVFAGDFGHCTPKGNELLARNIAEVILREVFNKGS